MIRRSLHNTIKELQDMPNGANIKLRCLLASKSRLQKKNGGDYLSLKLQDMSGSIETPIWDLVDRNDENLQENQAYVVTATRGDYQGAPQLKNPQLTLLDSPWSIAEFVPCYDIPTQCLDFFAYFLSAISDNRYRKILESLLGVSTKEDRSAPGKYELVIRDHTKWKKFIQAPAAVTHHGNKIGGLFLHTVGVAKAIDNMVYDYVEKPFFINASKVLDVNLLRFVAIIHDFCKTIEYSWESGVIKVDEDVYVNHDILIIQELGAIAKSELSQSELSKIYSIILQHHGQWSKYHPGPRDTVFVESHLLHVADMIDSKIVGETEKSERR